MNDRRARAESFLETVSAEDHRRDALARSRDGIAPHFHQHRDDIVMWQVRNLELFPIRLRVGIFLPLHSENLRTFSHTDLLSGSLGFSRGFFDVIPSRTRLQKAHIDGLPTEARAVG